MKINLYKVSSIKCPQVHYVMNYEYKFDIFIFKDYLKGFLLFLGWYRLIIHL